MDEWMVNQFNGENGLIYVFDPRPGVINGVLRDENTARFRKLENTAINMGVEYLCGCTILVIVSSRAVYFAHFFESLSWNPDRDILLERGNPSIDRNFRLSVLDFLTTGRDWPEGLVNENVRLAGKIDSFTTEFNTRAFILTPQNQRDPAEAAGAATSGRDVYIDGLLYKPLVDQLIAEVERILRVSVNTFTYQALDGTNRALDVTGRGKALFQYDPAARPGRKGVRLIFQGRTIRVTEPRRAIFPNGVVYEDYWNPNENRLLSEPESQDSNPDQQASASSCGGQIYELGDYSCYGDTLCPVLDGVATLLCGTQCYLESLYTCYDSVLCPVLGGVPTLRCGGDCYLPSQYKCESSHLIQLLLPDEDPKQSASHTWATSPTPTSTGAQGIEVVFNGTIYTIVSQPTTLTNDGTILVLGPGGFTIGSTTIPFPTGTEGPTAITTDGVTFTVWPPGHHASSSSSPSSTSVEPSTTLAPGPTPTNETPTPTATQTFSQASSSTVITITANDGSSTTEVTFTASTLTPFTTFTGTSTITTAIDAISTIVVVGPGGVAWIPTHPSTAASGFPPLPFPSQPPTPGATGTAIIPPATSGLTSSVSTSTYNPFPSSRFTIPPLITTTITEDGSGGPTTSTITGTTDTNGFVRPITIMSTPAAIASAKSLSSRLMSASGVIAVFSSSPENPASASSAVAAIETAKAGGNDFGIGLGISLPGLCLLFCGSAGSAVARLEDLLNAITGIVSGSSASSSLTGPLAGLASIANNLGEEAENADLSVTTTTSSDCIGTFLTNCDLFCVVTTMPGGTATTNFCYSTTCSVETNCGGSPTTFTSYDNLYCPMTYGDETMSLYSYPGYTLDPITTGAGDDDSSTSTPASTDITTAQTTTTEFTTSTETPSTSTVTPSSSSIQSTSTTTQLSTTTTVSSTTSYTTKTSSPVPSPTQPSAEYVSNCYAFTFENPSDTETCASFAERFEVTVQQLFDWNYSLQPADGSKTCDMHTAWSRGTRMFCIGVRESSTTSTTSTTDGPAPTLTRCSTYNDCPRCPQGEWRCCFSGCNGMLVPGSNYCACFKDGSTPGATCGCT
ncbi:hypothetical protein PMG11_01353 [Penicillium brasilianum]|uniref:Endo-1,3(4)-beta-glucanase 1 carbohydrate binding domain-containing protein n=1 Tax=Penicillium brasilianum TaxID=104259 RepID=A0A0F7THS6_PENBI|nr:hypothetical protein PMG11_01353 [Penicillium brasilianum]